MNSTNSKNITLLILMVLLLFFAGVYVLFDSSSNKDSIYTKIISS